MTSLRSERARHFDQGMDLLRLITFYAKTATLRGDPDAPQWWTLATRLGSGLCDLWLSLAQETG